MHLHDLYKHYLTTKRVSTDTRQIRGGEIFFALQGPNFNGNEYAKDALNNGAIIAVVDQKSSVLDERHILVDNVLKSLQDLATYHRSNLDIPVIGVGGSNGKTTTKELIHAALAKKYKVFATKGNLNNHIGVPLSILSIGSEAEIAVIELGANHEGEIAELCQIAQPTSGMVTNIGYDHLEGFGSIEGVARANAELYQYLKKKGGIAFLNSTDVTLSKLAKDLDTFRYPTAKDDYHCELLDAGHYLKLKTANDAEIETNLIGHYNFLNMAAALAIAQYYGVDAGEAAKAVAQYKPANNRSQLIEQKDKTILLDAYNANPSSVEVALKNFASMRFGRRCVILGDMYELGNHAQAEHEKIVKMVDELKMDEAYFCGANFEKAKAVTNSKNRHFYKDAAQLSSYLQNHRLNSDAYLIKGSRSMKMEELVPFI